MEARAMIRQAIASDHNQQTIDFYNQNADHFFPRFLGAYTAHLYDRFLSLLPQKAHILDAGCGAGRDTKYFLDQGYQVTAFDAAEELVKRSRDHTNHPILHMTFQDITFQEKFDGVWAMASLLHLNGQECLEVLEKNLIPALKPEGILYCCFQYGQDERPLKDRYFMDYDEKSLTALLSQLNNLTILDVWACEDHAPDRKGRLWINGLVRKG